jgi:hypothetical protein
MFNEEKTRETRAVGYSPIADGANHSKGLRVRFLRGPGVIARMSGVVSNAENIE